MIGWIDGSAGASGDMLLGALVDSGVPVDFLQETIDLLDVGVNLWVESVTRGGIGATKVHVDVPDTTTVRRFADIVEMLGVFPTTVRERAVATFRRLAIAEASVHRTTIDEVHFHEVGALDSIADIVGVCAGFVRLDLTELHCSTLSLGSGATRGEHGPIPVPAPAVLALLEGVAPVAAGPAPFESTTPTGAALLAEWVTAWGPVPSMTVAATGTGAGSTESDAVANACRLVIGAAASESKGRASGDPDGDSAQLDPTIPTGTAIQIETNIDDLDPRLWPGIIEATMAAGALDAWTTSIMMKKGRPATALSVLCDPDHAVAIRRLVFTRTSTIGLREHVVTRHVLDRRVETVDVDGRSIRVKVASIGADIVNRSAEWDDVAAAAEALGRTQSDVLAAANAAARRV